MTQPKKKPANARKTRPRSRPGAIPTWWIAVLFIVLAGLVWLRLFLNGGTAGDEPEAGGRAEQATAHHPPPPFPETPPEEAAELESYEAPPRTPSEKPAPSPPPPLPPPVKIDKGPRVAVVIDDVGYRMDLVQSAVRRLPRSVTFAVIPFLPASRESSELLHGAGYPVILHAPMEPLNTPRLMATKGMLLVGMPSYEIERILERSLRDVPHAEGMNNHMGSRATSDRRLMRSVMGFALRKKLYYLDSRTTAETVAYETARLSGVPSAERAVFLDDQDDYNMILGRIDLLANRALTEGDVVGIGHLRPNTIAALALRLPYWRERGVAFVPLREVVQ